MDRDLSQTRAFIKALTGSEHTPMTWQTLPDRGDNKELRQILHGPIDKLALTLETLNEKGAGIFITVNETDLKGRKADNICGVRALFVDSDSGPVKPTPIPPTMIIESARGEHAYWILDKNQPKEQFSSAQKAIAKALGTDGSVSDLPRVMRVPEFYHLKGEPFLVKIKSLNDTKPYTIKEVVSQFGCEEKQGTNYGLGTLKKIIGDVITQKEGGRHKALYAAAASVGELIGGGQLNKEYAINELYRVAELIANNGQRKIKREEIQKVLEDGIRKGAKNPRKGKEEKENKEDKKPRGPHPADMADAMCCDHKLARDHYDNVYRYNGQYWEGITYSELKAIAMRYDERYSTNDKRRMETIQQSLCREGNQHHIISWNKLAGTEIPLGAGVLDVLSKKMRGHAASDWLDKVVDIDYHEDATCPTWEGCLQVWFGNDPERDEKIAALQEFFGYVLLNHAKYKKALVLYGQGDTGKSVVANVLHELVGAKNCCQIGVDKMGDSRAIAPIKGKMLNLVTELPDEALISDGGFKQLISTGEPIEIDPKYAQPETYKPTCKHVVCCNSLPSINDKTSATYNRLLVLQFKNVIKKEDQDPELSEKLIQEIPGILNWACAGALRLTENKGLFTEIEDSKELIEEHRSEQNPVAMYLTEKYEFTENECQKIELRKLTRDFNEWLGGNRPWQIRSVGKVLSALGLRRKKVHGKTYVIGLTEKIYQ